MVIQKNKKYLRLNELTTSIPTWEENVVNATFFVDKENCEKYNKIYKGNIIDEDFDII